MRLTIEQVTALVYASEAMAREVERNRAIGLHDAANIWADQRGVVDDLRHAGADEVTP